MKAYEKNPEKLNKIIAYIKNFTKGSHYYANGTVEKGYNISKMSNAFKPLICL